MPLRAMLLLIVAAFATAGAQQRFTTQVMIVPAFHSSERGWGGKAADIVRSRVGAGSSRADLKVISGGDVDDWLRRSGFEQNAELSEGELKELAKKFRADERITGSVLRVGNQVQVDALLTPVRDLRLSQPVSATGANVDIAADAVTKEIIAARRQLIPLRQCENALRAGNAKDAVGFATTGIAAYARAIPARLCLLNALSHLDVPPDSIVAVAQAVLAIAPTSSIALGDLAMALDAQGKKSQAAPVWVRLLATDSSSEELIERVVNALSAEGNAAVAQPIIDRGTKEHDDNLILLKLRWMVHSATKDWKGAVEAGEKLLARDLAAQAEPEFYAKLATAYQEDSQPSRALAIAATGVSKFKDPGLFLVYVQLLRAENDAALGRGLAAFPDNPELHAFAAQNLKKAGNAKEALAETKRALAANPKLVHGDLQVAQLEFDLGELDSAYAAIEIAPKHGEDNKQAGGLALKFGNELYKAAATSQKRDDFQRAIRFLNLAVSLSPSAESKFLIGASSLSISLSAANEAPTSKSCDLSKLADSALTDAEINLVSGGSASPNDAKQLLDNLAKLRPFVADQLKAFCGNRSGSPP
jgi:tetratricopeptide (TPR) repeat protein